MKTQPIFRSLVALTLLLGVVWSCKKEETAVVPTPAVKSAAKDITKFSFAALSPAVDGTIDATAKTISATVLVNTDVTKLTPTLTISDKATVSPASGTVQDFSKEVSYTVTAEDASTQVWKVTTSVANICKVVGSTGSDGYSTASIQFTYDALNKIIKRTKDIKYTDGKGNFKSASIYSYDADGYITDEKETYVYAQTPATYTTVDVSTNYTYKDGRLIKSIGTSKKGDNTQSVYTNLYEYDTQGNLTKYSENEAVATISNGVITAYTDPDYTYGLNAQGFVSKVTKKSDNSYTLYQYDADGQQISVEYYDSKGVKTGEYYTSKYNTIKMNIPINPLGYKGHPNFKSIYGNSKYQRTQFKLGNSVSGNSSTFDYTYKTDAKGNVTSSSYIYTFVYDGKTDVSSPYTTNYTYQDCN